MVAAFQGNGGRIVDARTGVVDAPASRGSALRRREDPPGAME